MGDEENLAPGVQDVGPVNKNVSITKVSNGFIVYSGQATRVAYTFDELVGHLKEFFV